MRRSSQLALGIGLVLGGFVLGFLVGQWRWMGWGMEMLAKEVEGNLTQRIEVLSRLRTEDAEGAIKLLEADMDQAVITLAANERSNDLPTSTLVSAKVYRSVYPPPASTSRQLSDVFGRLPDDAPEYCSPALAKIVERSRTQTPAN